ncbi:MAG: antitoxin family protein, partial [Caldisphaeraceae archaeon]|nr:antitoxin family protein [Caldisphaeraceae archaeon]
SNIRWGLGLSKIIRVKYENGVLKPLTSINLEEGKEYKVIVEESIDELIKKYKGTLGKSSIKEFQELEEEAQVQ